jgi:putative ABC transport system ATP-binding protein
MKVKLENVSKHYMISGSRMTALDSLDFSVDEGTFVAVVGKSGSGKTTILNLVAGLDRPSSGRVEVGGADYSQLSDDELSNFRQGTIGYVFQAFYLEPRETAIENVWAPLLFGPASKSEMKDRAVEALRRVGLWERAMQHVATFSYGQRQRVAIARALVTRPRLLLADEPTGNLDRETGEAIIGLLEELNASEGLTLVMVTHDFRTVRSADRLFVLENGKGRFASADSLEPK